MLPGSEFVWGLILGIVPEIVVGMVLWNKRLRKSLRKDIRGQLLEDVDAGLLDPAIERATSGVETRIQEIQDLIKAEDLQAQVGLVQSRLEEVDQALEARLAKITTEDLETRLDALDEALGKHFGAIYEHLETMPARVRSSVAGSDGAEMKELYKATTAAEETAIQVYEAEMDPTERVIARIDAMEPSPAYREKHQVGSMIIDGVKELVKEQIRARRGNVVTMREVGGKRFPNVYGGG